LFHFSDIKPPHHRNLLWRSFTTPELQMRLSDEERVMRGILAQFRADSARYSGDPWFAELIADLQQTSEHFRQLWAEHDVLTLPNCHKEIEHPTLGHLEFEMLTLQEQPDTNIKVVAFMASPATADTLAAI
jgi:hypothetical protein